MFALEGPVVTELTTMIYATVMLKENLCEVIMGIFAVKGTLKLKNLERR